MTAPEPAKSTSYDNKRRQGGKHPHGNNTGLKQAYEFRDLAAKEAMALQECACASLEERVTRARALKDLNSVWFASSERIRIMRGKPMPGSLRPIAKPKKVRTVNTKPLEQLPIEHAQDKACLTDPLDKSDPSPHPGTGTPQ